MVKSNISFLIVVAAVLMLVGGVSAGFEKIDFEQDPLGEKDNGFESVDSSMVTFSDSFGSNLEIIGDSPALDLPEADGNSLAVNFDDASFLIMDFVINSIDLSLSFGNDDPGYAVPGDRAVLTLFLDEEQVAQTTVLMNLNDYIDQTIGIAGIEFDRATFLLNATEFKGLSEVVDNIKFREIPEPATLILLGIGSILLRKRKV